jgi:RNA recognition motif-containing protein
MKIYIGNLDERVRDSDLKEAFKDFGTVSSARVILDRYLGKSRGFGFIEMPDETEAQNVIKNVNGGTWEGKKLIIRKAYK